MASADGKVTNLSTSVSVSTTSNGDGQYVVPDLRPGTYSGTVTHPRFRLTTREGVVLQVGQTARVDVSLVLPEIA